MATDPAHGFLTEPPLTDAVRASFEGDLGTQGFVMNLSHLWAHDPAAHDTLFGLLADMVRLGGLTFRQRGILISAAAATGSDSYCALAWGNRLAGEAGPDVAAAVLAGDDAPLDPADAALAGWARTVARDANSTTPADLEPLRAAGFDDRQIFAITVFVALRRAFSMVNAALGALPDAQLRSAAPGPVDEAVSFGRPSAGAPSATTLGDASPTAAG
jgi:alkylhydroperoxidase family enzyme